MILCYLVTGCYGELRFVVWFVLCGWETSDILCCLAIELHEENHF